VSPRSALKEYGFVFALQTNIPLQNVQVVRERPWDQSSAAATGDEIQNMICRVRWIIREIKRVTSGGANRA